MDKKLSAFAVPNWYPRLSVNSFPTSFVFLRDYEIQALAEGVTESEAVDGIIPRLDAAMSNYGYNRFVFVDHAAPTDTERFKNKRGAVRSAKSAWNVLVSSEKIRQNASDGKVTAICVRPFRRMNPAREFRLFIKGGELRGMSQYWLVAHFPRLMKYREQYWDMAKDFVMKNAFAFPCPDVVADIYFTSSDEILIIDLNPFAPPTDAKMFNTLDRTDWMSNPCIKIVPVPHKVSGDVNVSF